MQENGEKEEEEEFDPTTIAPRNTVDNGLPQVTCCALACESSTESAQAVGRSLVGGLGKLDCCLGVTSSCDVPNQQRVEIMQLHFTDMLYTWVLAGN